MKMHKKTVAAILSFCMAASMGNMTAISAAAEETPIEATVAGSSKKGDTNADGIINVSDVVLLQKYLVSTEKLNDNQLKNSDMSEDGKVNVFDVVLLRRQLLGLNEEIVEGEAVQTMVKASDNSMKFVGRTLNTDGSQWLLHSGSAAEFTVTGQSAELVLSGKNGIHADEDHRPRYAVYVDDEILTDETLDSAEEKITLFDGSVSVSKRVKVIMLSEAMYGAIGIDCINVKSASKTPVKPTAKKNLSIEFIGDSITCAYGVEGSGSYESFKTTTENFTKSYAYLTAQKLDADYSAVCYSGHGIISGYSSDGTKNSESLIPDYYELASKIQGYNQSWDFSQQDHDAVVINLGTNDINYVNAEPETRSQEFIDGYIDFLKTVRKNNSNAHIVCTVGTMGGDEIYELIEKAIENYTAETSDKKVSCYKSVTHTQADGMGSDWHPSAATQQNSAYVLADKICQALGMESDQVGLDVAANAVYDVDINSGANAAHYVGYDKSFWINMVSGGTKAEDIIAYLAGISLKNDGEYRLEFDYTTSVEMDFIVSVKGNDTYFSDTVSSDAEKKHYSETFKVNADDGDSKITFDIGGGSSYNVTLSAIKLVKIK